MLLFHLSTETVKSPGFNIVLQTVHLLCEGRNVSLIDFNVRIAKRIDPHFLQTTFTDDSDIKQDKNKIQ